MTAKTIRLRNAILKIASAAKNNQWIVLSVGDSGDGTYTCYALGPDSGDGSEETAIFKATSHGRCMELALAFYKLVTKDTTDGEG